MQKIMVALMIGDPKSVIERFSINDLLSYTIKESESTDLPNWQTSIFTHHVSHIMIIVFKLTLVLAICPSCIF